VAGTLPGVPDISCRSCPARDGQARFIPIASTEDDRHVQGHRLRRDLLAVVGRRERRDVEPRRRLMIVAPGAVVLRSMRCSTE
jgi:hypothetical protein